MLPSVIHRFVESIDDYDQMIANDDQFHSIPVHAKLWHCAVNANSDMGIIIGHGSGDEVETLKVCMMEKQWDELARYHMDSHNEYLSSYVRHGVVGILIFLASLGYGFYLAIAFRNPAYLVFMIMISVAALSESILRGQVSLLMYAFFNSCFARYCLSDDGNVTPSGKLPSRIP
jgi:hypothetical protein